MIEQTFAMIKPDAIQRGLIGNIISRIENKGLKIIYLYLEIPGEEFFSFIYREHINKDFYPTLINFSTSSPVVFLIIEGLEAVSVMRNLVGTTKGTEALPGTIRGDLSNSTSNRNLIHASATVEDAKREIRILTNNAYFSKHYKKEIENWIYSEKDIQSSKKL